MKYMGSKTRIAKDILPIILEHKEEAAYYIEPFVGGANMIDKVDHPNKLGLDANVYVINALKLIRDNPKSLPKDNKEFTEQDYNRLRKDISNRYIDGLSGYAAFALSYGGKEWGGWRRDSAGKRDYVKEAYNNALKQSPKIRDTGFTWIANSLDCRFDNIKKSIIYCDPPYQATTKYGSFNHKSFWEWVRHLSKNHWVYVSEYNAPDDFECLWEKEIVSSLTKNTGAKKGIERLFKLKELIKND